MQDKNGKNHKQQEREHSAHLFFDADTIISDNRKERRRLRYENARLFKSRNGWMAIDSIAHVKESSSDEIRENAFNRGQKRKCVR